MNAVDGKSSLLGVDVIASDWNNRIRSVVLQLTSKIPEVGAIASFIIGSFWPQDKVDVFEAIKEDIRNLIRKEILEYELNVHKSEIDGLKMILTRYQEVVVREWNRIDAMQFIYENRQGALAGNPNGRQRHDIDVGGRLLNGLYMGFSSGVLASVQILYYDGTSSSQYGNRSGWSLSEISAQGPVGYKITSWSYKIDHGPSNTYGQEQP
ncbi:hypothetical protein KP509_17G045100 [Ceratopteris richardii]|uniref:Pesticidal crystal protein domain-containing protein n=1 Tax=Ceratopteris richardii TaxID=49495 RepID=A0A8T2SUN6_CERRI|nr:hypothetical protein KP509_17G045100 [Ceratopteris richardii]